MPILSPVNPCVTVIKHVWPKARRVIHRAILHHAHKALGVTVAVITCAAPPVLYFSLPPTTAPSWHSRPHELPPGAYVPPVDMPGIPGSYVPGAPMPSLPGSYVPGTPMPGLLNLPVSPPRGGGDHSEATPVRPKSVPEPATLAIISLPMAALLAARGVRR